eukprot:TRINITY_DN40721_c0_g1_i1.p1 TRINITY_DN40721_c0_g1~~TRINITY_DN40721_c0_g1_i1.p1  ORF type:complete len:1623 (-),score=320.68 TRINITY_DN40721_c0_g1_i1:52-4398(-)
MDEDGLADPCYAIRVEDVFVTQPESMTKALDCLFSHRYVIPISREWCDKSQEKLLDDPWVPLAPVLFKMIDKDQHLLLESIEQVTKSYKFAPQFVTRGIDALHTKSAGTTPMSTVVIKEPQNFDACLSPEQAKEPLDLNNLHKAKWYALDAKVSVDFDPSIGGCETAWKLRPRVLLACGASVQRNIKGLDKLTEYKQVAGGYQVPLITDQIGNYVVTVDLLGIRNLVLSGLSLTNKMDLEITSFWKGAVSIKFEENAHPNFEATKEDPQRELFIEQVKPRLRIVGEGLGGQDDEEMGSLISERDEEAALLGDSAVIPLDSLLGYRIVSPDYVVPIIGYLQKKASEEYGLPTDSEEIRASRKDEAPKSDVVVLMPDIVFRIRKSVTFTDCGSLSVTLPIQGNSMSGGDLESWADLAAQEYRLLDAKLKSCPTLMSCTMEDAYDMFVDVFASTAGDLYWDSDVSMGRSLQSQRLFYIAENGVEEDDDESGDDDRDPKLEKKKPISQYFNPADNTCSDPRLMRDAFDHRYMPCLRCAEWDVRYKKWKSLRQNVAPLGPSKLFQEFLAKKSKDLSGLSTRELRAACTAEKWRCATHLASPEPPEKGGARDGVLESNLHTFIRDVGHAVTDTCRDSRILGRLRMTLPDVWLNKLAEDSGGGTGLDRAGSQESDDPSSEKLKIVQETHENMHNFLVIKFNLPGVVVWVTQDTFSFNTPGQTIMAVKLSDGSDIVVPVVIPVFDLRFPREAGWYVKKTCMTRWRSLENRINEAKAKKDKKSKAAVMKSTSKSLDVDGEKGEKGDKEASAANKAFDRKVVPQAVDKKKHSKEDERGCEGLYPPDGITQPIKISKYAFVCRIQKRSGSHNFDRARTNNWYRCVLEDLFPEVKALPVDKVDDRAAVRTFFLSRFMNLRQPLTIGEVGEVAGMLKGHVTIKRIGDLQDTPAAAKLAYRKDSGKNFAAIEEIQDNHHGMRPLQNLWVSSEVNVNVYVLGARNLKLDDCVSENPNLWLKCSIVGTKEEDSSDVIEGLEAGATAVDFYRHIFMNPSLPGASTMRLEIWHQGLLNRQTLVGSTEIDLEDRFLVLFQRKLRAGSNADYLDNQVSPKETVPVYADKGKMTAAGRRPWIEPKDPKSKQSGRSEFKIEPHVAPLPNLPIEIVDLTLEDEHTGANVVTGSMRFWVDLTRPEQFYHTASLSSDFQEFEVRLTIAGITNISIFMDSYASRNDVKVITTMRYTDRQGKYLVIKKSTDVHKWAQDEANFNWRHIFHVQAPALQLTLEFSMVDVDLYADEEHIYEPKVEPLDHMLMLAADNAAEGRPSLGVDSRQIIFDAWPKKHVPPAAPLKGCCCCRRRATDRVKPEPATMKISVEVLPKAEALLHPVSEDRITPEVPKGRMGWATAVSAPSKFIKVLLGPNNVDKLTKGCSGLACFILVLLLLVAGFMILNSPPFSLFLK